MTVGVETAGLRCSARSLALGEDQAGTASTVRAFLLVEHGGPWGVSAVRDAPMPDGVSTALRAACDDIRVRPLLVRRHRSRPGLPERPRVMLAVCDRSGGRTATRTLGDARAVPELPLADLVASLRAGHIPDGWYDVPRLFLTCTHGRHDACCAERGRPVAAALHEVAGDAGWEVSHIGGDRFAGNVLVLPDGLYYGRVTAERAGELVDAHRRGECVPALLRGRTSLPFAGQAAEIALRHRLGVTGARAVRLAELARDGRRTTTTWAVDGRGWWRVVVDTCQPGPRRALTCSAGEAAPPVHTVVEVAAAEAAGHCGGR
ncbi:MAG: sucrase ferredoxin [Streptosporangiaceae bacterium]